VGVGALAGAALGLIEAAASRQLARRSEHDLDFKWRVFTAALEEAQKRTATLTDEFARPNPNTPGDTHN
jgi:hypothetical protein